MKRSEFYAMFITMILLFTASMSWAVSYQPQIIQPTKPYQACYLKTDAATNTYYTCVDVSGSGVLNYINLYTNSSENYQNTIKITIDGIAYEIKGPSSKGQGVYSSGAYTYYGTTATKNYHQLIFNATTYFKTSLKIEVKHELGSADYIDATANYALE